MDLSTAAELQVLLEGIPLPTRRSQLLDYAGHQRATSRQLAILRGLPARQYDNLDEVAETLVHVQPSRKHEEPHSPHEESGAPPGGDAYTQPRTESGQVRDLNAVS